MLCTREIIKTEGTNNIWNILKDWWH